MSDRFGRTGPVALEGRPGPRLEQGTGESGRIRLPRRRSMIIIHFDPEILSPGNMLEGP